MDDKIEIKLKKIFLDQDNRALCVACDHGLMTDPDKSWLQISQIVRGSIQEKADGLLLSSGQARRFVSKLGSESMPPLIIRTDWTNLLRLRKSPEDQGKLLPVESMEYRRLMTAHEVLDRYGAAAAIGFLFIDPEGKFESLTLKASRELIQECHEISLPCIIEVLPFIMGQAEGDPTELIKNGIWKALELGADAIKLPLTDEIQENCAIIRQAGKRSFVLGGGQLSDEDVFVAMMQKALSAGADGLLVGRNVSQSEDPAKLISKLRSIVHPVIAKVEMS